MFLTWMLTILSHMYNPAVANWLQCSTMVSEQVSPIAVLSLRLLSGASSLASKHGTIWCLHCRRWSLTSCRPSEATTSLTHFACQRSDGHFELSYMLLSLVRATSPYKPVSVYHLSEGPEGSCSPHRTDWTCRSKETRRQDATQLRQGATQLTAHAIMIEAMCKSD